MTQALGYLGIDQYGRSYHLKKHPRKELLEKLGATHADKMYVDNKDGKSKCTGYIINGLWIDVYAICVWKGRDRGYFP